MQIMPLTGGLGAEILNADLKDSAQFDAVYQAFVQHSVVVIRDQDISPDDHLGFARHFGTINVNRFFKAHPDFPEIATVTKEPDQRHAIGEHWHTDHAYDQIPAMGSILHAIETPPFGGDTVFVSMAMAYEALSDRFKELIGGLNAWHSSRHVFGASQSDSETNASGRVGNQHLATQDALHPVVIRHPLSGRPGLYVNPQFTTRIDGLSDTESAALLSLLFDHCQRPEFQCRVRWQTGDITLWDNRATWHKAINDYHGHRRHMHRITVEGCALEPAVPS